MLYLTSDEYNTPIQYLDAKVLHRVERAAAKQYGWKFVDNIMSIIATKSLREAAAAFDCLSCFRILL